jgi:hypothetical protein
VNSGAPEGEAVPAPHVTPVVLLELFFEDTKAFIRNRNSRKDSQYNGQKKRKNQ